MTGVQTCALPIWFVPRVGLADEVGWTGREHGVLATRMTIWKDGGSVTLHDIKVAVDGIKFKS